MSAFSSVGSPRRSTAQGRDFESKLVKSLCELYGIQKTWTTAYPCGNAQCEQFSCFLHDLLRTLPPEQKSKWPQYPPELVQAYNNMPHTSTEFSPHFLLFGRKPQLPVDPCAWAHNHIRGWTHQLGTAASAAPAGFACRGTKTSPRNCS